MQRRIQSNAMEIDKNVFALNLLLPEMITTILLTVFDSDFRHEFPKLFCICKKWIELLDCNLIHEMIEKKKEKWHRNKVQYNLRMFNKTIFSKVLFHNNRVSNATQIGLLHSGSLVQEIGRIDTANGVYCETVNGCSRFQNQNGEVYLQPVDILELGTLWTPKKNKIISVYILERHNRQTSLVKYDDNVVFPGTMFEEINFSTYQGVRDNYVEVYSENTSIWLNKDEVQEVQKWYFTFPSIDRKFGFTRVKSENEEQFLNEKVQNTEQV